MIMGDINRQTIAEGVNFTSIYDNRFKTGRISVSIILPLSEQNTALNGFLPYILRRSCKAYPNFRELNQCLNDLYGASLNVSVNKVGDYQVATLSAVVIDDLYTLNRESVSEQMAKLLCSMIFEPNLDGEKFIEEELEQEKRQYIEQIDSEINEKRIYAINRCISLMCKDEPHGINRLGTRNSALKITTEAIYKAWKGMLAHAAIEVMSIGSSEPKGVLEGFKNEFSKYLRTPISISTSILPARENIHQHIETMDVAQAKLVMGMRSMVAQPQKDVMPMRLMAMLYGGTPNSKLFANVREKLSLCYYCVSRYDRHKGIICVDSGVELPNVEKAKEEILKQFEDIKKGNFTKEEIQATKLSAKNQFLSTTDSLRSIQEWYLMQIFDRSIKTPKQVADDVERVTKDDIVDAANSVSLDTIYTLTSKGGN